MSVHVDVTWYGCPGCHTIWPDDRVCCDPIFVNDQNEIADYSKLEWPVFHGATLTYYWDLPDENPGGLHHSFMRYCCDLADREEALDLAPSHWQRRAGWLVEFDDDRVQSMGICPSCARQLFGVEQPSFVDQR